MSGKRILDAVALLNASRNVAAKHLDIRLSQLELYSKTSSIGKGFRRHTEQPVPKLYPSDRSFSNSATSTTHSSHSLQRSQDTQTTAQHSITDSPVTIPEGREPLQDHHYEKSERHSVVDSLPKEELDIEQEKAQQQPLPDGTIPPEHGRINTSTGDLQSFSTRPTTERCEEQLETVSLQKGLKVASSLQNTIPYPEAPNSLCSENVKALQRKSEFQIPATPAEPPESKHEFGVEQEQDVFYQPPGTTSPVLSALPRIRLPKVEWDVQGGDPHIPPGTNADVYYSGQELVKGEPSEEMLSQMFHSPRVARIMSKKGGPGSRGARAFHKMAPRRQGADREKEDVNKLAAEMAKDAQNTKSGYA